MTLAEQQPKSLNIQLLVDSIPALIHTARPDGYLDYFNQPWLDYLGASLDDVTGWNWTAFVHPEDVDGIVAQWQACLATGEIFEYEARVRSANGEYLDVPPESATSRCKRQHRQVVWIEPGY